MNFRFWESDFEDEISLVAACGYNIGKRRPENEDNFFFDGKFPGVETKALDRCFTLQKPLSGYTMLAVFDGMGGGDYGEVASYEAAVSVAEFMRSNQINPVDITPSLTKMCEMMNDRVFEQSCNLGAHQMGTTLVALFLYSGQFWVCNIGDSRLYAKRNEVVQLSVDHTDEEFMREQGITNRKPYLTQFIGMDPNETAIVPYIKSYYFERGDRFLLCSDGVTDMIDLNRISEILNKKHEPEAAVKQLIYEALENGGKDNITAIVCDIR